MRELLPAGADDVLAIRSNGEGLHVEVTLGTGPQTAAGGGILAGSKTEIFESRCKPLKDA